MNKTIKQTLKDIDKALNEKQPKTMDELICAVHVVPGVERYGTHFHIIKYKGYLQGIRVYVTGNKISHALPSNTKVYSVFKGVDKYEKAGYPVEYSKD